MEKFIEEYGRKIPVIRECDVVVCGGGVAGVSAALAAARNGAKVCMIEKGYCLGGLATLGLVAIYLPLCDGNGNQVIGGISEELFHLAIRYGPGTIPDCWKEGGDVSERAEKRLTVEFNPAWFQLALEKLLIAAGVEIIYDSRLCAAEIRNNRIDAVIVENKSGRCAVACKAAIDATGDADLCFMSGEETVSVDTNRRTGWFYSYSHGKVKLHIHGDIFFLPVPEGSWTCSGDNWKDVSRFMTDSRKLIMDEVQRLREMPENDDLVPLILPSIPQFRRTRRLKGLYEIEETDENRYFEDSVGMTGYYRKRGLVLYYPYRCLIGKTENLFTAGRCISSKEDYAWNISRGIPSCAITGQASGAAAAMCVKQGLAAQKLNAGELQSLLLSQGVRIDSRFAK